MTASLILAMFVFGNGLVLLKRIIPLNIYVLR